MFAPATEAPRTWKDLLDPRWKDRLVTAHPGYSGVIATHVLALVHLYGWDYWKQLAQDRLMLVQSAVDPAGVVASGEPPAAVERGACACLQAPEPGEPVAIALPHEAGAPCLTPPPTPATAASPRP